MDKTNFIYFYTRQRKIKSNPRIAIVNSEKLKQISKIKRVFKILCIENNV